MQQYASQKNSRKWVIFLLGGIVNTAFCYACYFIFLKILSYQTAYFLSYFIGLIFSYYYNCLVVFKSTLSLQKFLSYPVVYILQYSISALVLTFMVSVMKISETYAPLLVSVILAPLSYAMNEFALSRTKKSQSKAC